MTAIRTIVAGIADPDGPDPVLRYSVELARRVGSTLHLVHAYPPPETAMSMGIAAADMMAGLPPVPLWNIPEETRALHEALTTRIRAQLGTESGSPAVEIHLEPGAAHHAVAQVAESVGADLVAVGAAHHRGLLGSTTEKTIREVPFPTLVLRRPLPAGGSRVLLTTDLSEISATACASAIELVRELFRGEGFACRCLYTAAGVTGEIAPIDDDELRQRAQAELDAFIARLPASGIVVQPVVRIGAPAEEIVAEAADWPSDLIVLGTHARTGISHLLLGSVAENVVRHVVSDALVIRTPAEA
ncbi:MAG: universal stress protein [Gemmatimonadetes bacterium]|nr:universal stress protein [Gemmatimonadota bacterium]